MKQLESRNLIKVMVLAPCLIFAWQSLNAQDFGITNRPRVNNINRGATKKSSTSNVQAVRVIYTPVYKTKETKPTGIAITTLPDADIVLESIGPGVKIKENNKANNQGVLTFENLKPGRYKLITSFAGYQSQESEVTIVSQKILTLPIILKKITYEFSIQTNVERGEVRFAPVKIIGQNPNGTLMVQETGGYCIVPVKNKTAVIRDLPEGNYNIDVRSVEPEYQPELAVIEIPEDIPEPKPDDPNGNKSFSINLEHKLSTGTFNQILTQDAWVLPGNWKIDTKGLKVDGDGIAMPKNKDYRYYKDFEMQSAVRLLKNTSVGFVVRAQDNENYYLIQLTGAGAPEPYRVSGFIVKNGTPERIMDNPIPFLSQTIDDQKYFGLIIKGQGNQFDVVVEDSKTGNKYPLGKVVFQNNNFPIGAVGIKGREESSFEIGLFTVCNQICQ
jgi:hypothetical protein